MAVSRSPQTCCMALPWHCCQGWVWQCHFPLQCNSPMRDVSVAGKRLTFSLDLMWVADDSRLCHCHMVILEENRTGVWLSAFSRLAATWKLP